MLRPRAQFFHTRCAFISGEQCKSPTTSMSLHVRIKGPRIFCSPDSPPAPGSRVERSLPFLVLRRRRHRQELERRPEVHGTWEDEQEDRCEQSEPKIVFFGTLNLVGEDRDGRLKHKSPVGGTPPHLDPAPPKSA